jgi:hypothetical protein
MALASASGLASFDQSAGEFLDLSNELAEIIRRDNTAFISRIGISGEATETTHSWMEDVLNPNTATAAEAIDNSETAIDVATGHGARFKVGTLFRVAMQGKTEVMQVTAISGDTLTVVRGYGSTSAEDYGATTNHTLQIIAHPNQESQDPPADESRARTKVSNYTQIFQRGIQISHTMRSVLQAGVADEFTFQIARRMLEIERELDSSVILGIKSADAGSDSSYRTMGGLIEFVSQPGGNTNSTAEDLTPTVINTMVKQIWDDGGTPNFILVSGKQKQKISAFDQANRRSTYDSTVAGYVVNKFLSDLGFSLEVIVDPWVPDDVCIVGDINKVRILPLRNDAMRVEELAKTGRSWKAQVTGQYTCEVRNAKEAFAIHTNLN